MKAFTLVEIAVTLALIGIVTGIAFTNHNTLSAKSLVREVAFELGVSTRLARSYSSSTLIEIDTTTGDPDEVSFNPGNLGDSFFLDINIEDEGIQYMDVDGLVKNTYQLKKITGDISSEPYMDEKILEKISLDPGELDIDLFVNSCIISNENETDPEYCSFNDSKSGFTRVEERKNSSIKIGFLSPEEQPTIIYDAKNGVDPIVLNPRSATHGNLIGVRIIFFREDDESNVDTVGSVFVDILLSGEVIIR